MTRFLPSLLAVALCASACTPTLRLEVLQPSLVTSPPEIKQLTVVDRSRSKNVGQGILGALEGALTGEAIGADNTGRSRAMTSAVTTLRASPRFDAAETFASKKDLESNLFAKEVSWNTANRICEESGCQGIIALEAFDSDSFTDVTKRIVTETRDGKEVKRAVFTAERTTNVVTAWRYYDVVNRQVIDDVRTFDSTRTWREEGPTSVAAMARLPNQRASVAMVGEMAGVEYAMRVAPSYVWVSRTYYGKGHPELKRARNSVRAMDWNDAITVWTELHRSSSDVKVKGKSAYNLALAAERAGDLQGAAGWATEGAKLLSNGRARNYRRVLQSRMADEARLQEQMEPAREAPLALPGQ